MPKVLVVEDSLTQREIIREVLEQSGLETSIAHDGIEALEQLEEYRPDVIILDIVMPRLNGYQVCRKLKSNPQTKDIPVIFCSSKDQELDLYWGIKQGADAYLVKPFDPVELIGTIINLLRKQKNQN
jgi:twitching motility two-component system response regulator PilH